MLEIVATEDLKAAAQFTFNNMKPYYEMYAVDWDVENIYQATKNLKNFDFKYTSDEIKILKKISEWPKCIEVSANKLEPHRIPVYLYELASEFHFYWNMGKEKEELRFISKEKILSDEKLVFLKAISTVIKTGMNIVGVDTPEKM